MFTILSFILALAVLIAATLSHFISEKEERETDKQLRKQTHIFRQKKHDTVL
jgi:hypothetical protein